MINASVVVVNWNTKELLENCLSSLDGEERSLQLEILVVDNNSSDGSADMVASKFPDVKLIRNQQNRGFAKANNQALSISSGRYILLLNSDACLVNNSISLMLEFMDSRPEAGIIGPRLLNADGSLQFSCYNVPSVFRTFLEMTFISRLFPWDTGNMLYHFGYDKIKEVGYVSGACMMIRREVLDDIGLLDERFFIYAEEADFCMRAKESGWKIFFIPGAKVKHYLRQSVGRYGIEKMTAEKLKSNYLLFRKHYGKLSADMFVVLSCFWELPKLLLFLFDKERLRIPRAALESGCKLLRGP